MRDIDDYIKRDMIYGARWWSIKKAEEVCDTTLIWESTSSIFKIKNLCYVWLRTYLNLEILIERKLNIKVSSFLIGVYSAGISNSISDALGFLLQAEFVAGVIVGLGCLIAMALIPALEYFKNKKEKEQEKEVNIYDFK